MDSWDPINAAFSTLGFDPTGTRGFTGMGGDPTGVRGGQQSAFSGDPTGVRDWSYGFEGLDPLLDIGLPAMEAGMQPQNPWIPNQATMGGGSATTLGGNWAGVDQWNTAISKASAQYGVPANLIKAVMMRESGGQNLSINDSFAVGPMQVTTNNWGNLGYDLYDPNQNIMAGAAVLKQMYDSMGSWEGAVRAYLAGPGGAYKNVTDSFGTDPTSYWSDVSGYWNQLNSGSGTAGIGYSGGGGNMSSMFGQYGASIPTWGEFGVGSSNGFYDYGTQYGLNGVQHTGLDIPMPIGTAYRAPSGGVVTCSGTGIGPGANGGGCAAFRDVIGGGVGRVEVQLDNGVILIYGHSNAAALRPGQRFNAGAVLGWSGGEVSPHVHLEARVVDPSMPSGYRIVDPRTVLSGMPTGTWSSAQSNGQQQPRSMQDAIIGFMTQPGYSW